MTIVIYFLCFGAILISSCEQTVDAFQDKTLGENLVTPRSKPTDKDDNRKSISGTKKFDEPNYFDQESFPKFKDTSSIVNEALPEIKGRDVSPEQEMIMAAAQDSNFQQASIGAINGQDIGALSERTLQHTSTPDTEERGESFLDDDNDILSSDSLMAFGNFSQNGGDSEDLDDDYSSSGDAKQRQVIHYPDYHGNIPLQPMIKVPQPYPAVIHVRLPGNVNILPKIYPVHHYRPVPIPMRYHRLQDVNSPYYVPFKTGPDVEETHLNVYHPLSPCKNGGLLLKSSGGMVCLCTREYQGRFCEDKLFCASKPCLYGGKCDEIPNNYRCICPKGYRGYNCEVRDECALSPCKNDGTCVETLNGFRCVCPPGFTGENCESPDFCVPNPCQHWGTCIQTQTGHECQCPPHFKGPLCEKRRRCFTNPCKNGGKCVEDVGRFPCLCPHGYKPPFCKNHVCSHHPCLNGGKCAAYGSTHGWYYKCHCPLLYRGEHCEIPNPCVTNPCLNAGRCIDSYSEYSGFPGDWNARHLHYICVCPPGYFGPKCEDNICSKCHKNATCVSNRCICMDGFLGDGFYCRHIVDPCVPNPCYNNATCTVGPDESFDCRCPPGYVPPLCKDKDPCIPNPCKNGGTCKREVIVHTSHSHVTSEFKCFCPAGFSPPDCRNTTVNPCVPNPCLNGGTCLKDSTKKEGYTCKCAGPHFVLPNCRCDCPKGDPYNKPYPILPSICDAVGEQCTCSEEYTFVEDQGCKYGRQNPCLSNPCLNNGTCITEGDNWKCNCPSNCQGVNCQYCNVCTRDYCYNGGTCISVGLKLYCRCPKDFLPPRCIIKIPGPTVYFCHPNPCLNYGECVERHNGYDCHCIPPYDGPHCEHDKCMDCDVHAICTLGQCKCRKGYYGSGYKGDCIKEKGCPVCPVNAMCIDNSCKCVPGFMLEKQNCIPVDS